LTLNVALGRVEDGPLARLDFREAIRDQQRNAECGSGRPKSWSGRVYLGSPPKSTRTAVRVAIVRYNDSLRLKDRRMLTSGR
jgi:hypothetical protein